MPVIDTVKRKINVIEEVDIIHFFLLSYNIFQCLVDVVHRLHAMYYRGWPIKTERIRHTAYYTNNNVDAISVYEVTSPEKTDTKISKFGTVVCFLGHILWDNVEAQFFPFQFKLVVNECHFGLPQLWAVIHLTSSLRIVTSGFLVQRMRIDKVN